VLEHELPAPEAGPMMNAARRERGHDGDGPGQDLRVRAQLEMSEWGWRARVDWATLTRPESTR
jgi:hypothetical protein